MFRVYLNVKKSLIMSNVCLHVDFILTMLFTKVIFMNNHGKGDRKEQQKRRRFRRKNLTKKLKEKKQVYIDKITNRISWKSLETLSRLYDIMTNLD